MSITVSVKKPVDSCSCRIDGVFEDLVRLGGRGSTIGGGRSPSGNCPEFDWTVELGSLVLSVLACLDDGLAEIDTSRVLTGALAEDE